MPLKLVTCLLGIAYICHIRTVPNTMDAIIGLDTASPPPSNNKAKSRVSKKKSI